MSLYHYPDLYAALRAPDPVTLRGARAAVATHLRGEWRSVMDPACGPANWLLPFAIDDLFVAGNDIHPEMVARARRVLGHRPSEIIQGDMRDLRFTRGPFDVVIELAGTCSQLDPDDFAAHLRSVAAHLREGGLFLMTLFFEVRRESPASTNGSAASPHVAGGERAASVGIEKTPIVSYQSGPIPLERGGSASVRYEVVAWNPTVRREQMRRIVRTDGAPGVPPVLEDEYTLRIWDEREAEGLIHATGLFDILDTDAIRHDGQSDPEGERTMVLRRRSARA